LGDESVEPHADAHPEFADTLAAVASDPTRANVEDLAGFGIGAIDAPPPVARSVATALDSAPDLAPSGSSVPNSRVWTVENDVGSATENPSDVRPWLVAGQLIVFIVVLVVATPGRRSR